MNVAADKDINPASVTPVSKLPILTSKFPENFDTPMNEEVKNKIKQLSDAELTFDPRWTWDLLIRVEDIFDAGEWEERDEIIDNLPEKIRTVYLIASFGSSMAGDGLFGMFYNYSLYEMKRLRHAISLSGLKELSDLYNEALRQVEDIFTWSDEHANFTFQTSVSESLEDEFYSDERMKRIEEIEKQLYDTLFYDNTAGECCFTDEIEKHLEAYIKS